MADRLVGATSPYLRQHANNPVDWYPWGDEPFQVATERNLPVFISIGYAACHWCHVMAHESFENEEVGSLLNESFVSIKVDREEHPTVDHFYMSAAAAMGKRGGWPLTILATPDRRPFYCATYLPIRSQQGRLGLLDLLSRVATLWQESPEEVVGFGDEMVALLERAEPESKLAPFSETDLRNARNRLHEAFDDTWGGFGTAPKFPTAHQLRFLLRCSQRFQDQRAVSMVGQTLENMSRGGMFDQIGGGAHRYSTDREWKLPHFEKMLIDQAMLVVALVEAYQVTNNQVFADTAETMISYVLRDLLHPDGPFYSSEDADSEGSEGVFYLWSFEELSRVLSPGEVDHLKQYWHVERSGNVNDEATGMPTGLNILHGFVPLDETRARAEWRSIAERLMDVRSERIRPLLDDKILTDWNGGMIAALALAGRVCGNPDWIGAAEKAALHLISTARMADGRLVHVSRQSRHVQKELLGATGFPSAACADETAGYLDDYAFFVWGCLELFQATGNPAWLRVAGELSRKQIDLFWDSTGGGFFLNSKGSAVVPVRQKNYSDAAYPAGASVTALNFLRLNAFLANPEFEQIALTQLGQIMSVAASYGMGFSSALSAIDFALGPIREIVHVVGQGETSMDQAIAGSYLPNSIIVRVSESNREELLHLMPHLVEFESRDGLSTVYVCVDRTCELPVTDTEALSHILQG